MACDNIYRNQQRKQDSDNTDATGDFHEGS